MENVSKEVLDQMLGALSTPSQLDAQPFIAIPNDFKVADLEKFQASPTRIRQNVELKTAESFIEYTKRFSNNDSVIFANLDSRTIEAVMDYHKAELAEWCDHTARYRCPLSKEWKAWVERDRSAMNQIEFAEFLEARCGDIAPVSESYAGPTGAELLNLALNFQVTRDASFSSVQRLQDGTFQFAFSEENKGNGNTTLPETIRLGIQPFHGGDHYAIDVRVRYRLREGSLKLWFELIDPEKVLEDAFKGIQEKVKESLPECLLLEGSL